MRKLNYVIFSHWDWPSFPYKRYIHLLPEREQTLFLGQVSQEERQSFGLQPIAPSALAGLEKGAYAAIVASPYLLPLAWQVEPLYIIALVDRAPGSRTSGNPRVGCSRFK